MKRFAVLVSFVLGLTSIVYAGQMRTENVIATSGSATIALVTDQTTYTHSFPIKSGEYFALAYKATSVASTPAVQVELEQSFELPTVEGDPDSEWIEPDNMADIVTAGTVEAWKIISLSPVPMPYARFKLTNKQALAGDTIVNLKVSVVEED